MELPPHWTADGQLVIGSGWKQRFRRRLLCWYGRAARDLPWRRTRDPYAIWVSEVMLQQTQVASVTPYFLRFLDTFPDIQSLARADEGRVLRVWEGLGYYRRARQLHQAARIVVAQHNARFPRDADAATRLPGIGRYTAGAILSIAFDVRLPILEANTVRLLSRLLAYDRPPTGVKGQRLLWSLAEQVLPRRNVGKFNQALMDLGNTLCTPRNPKCTECPVATQCQARRLGVQETIPVRKKPVRYETLDEVAVIIRHRGRVLLRRCAANQRWAGLWDFPRFAIRRGPGRNRELVHQLRQSTGLVAKISRRLTTMQHGVTRFRITLDCYEASLISGQRRIGADFRWVWPSQFELFPLCSTGRKMSQLLLERKVVHAASRE